MQTATSHFRLNSEYGLIICKDCCYAVWPNQLANHMRRHHREVVKERVTDMIATIDNWTGILRNPLAFTPPSTLPEPVEGLRTYTDGLRCKVNKESCTYVCRDSITMRRHWTNKHQWSQAVQQGRPTPQRQVEMRRAVDNGTERVGCQRFFIGGSHSHYIPIEPFERAEQLPERTSTNEASSLAWTRSWELGDQAFDKQVEDGRRRIQLGEKDEANPWIRRTGWAVYLANCERDALVESVAAPEAERPTDLESGDWIAAGESVIERHIWAAMMQLGIVSQATSMTTGHAVRISVVQTEEGAEKFVPLSAYQERMDVMQNVRPWQQILMFFLRTQRAHDWEHPVYKFSRDQYEAFRKMRRRAEEEVAVEGRENRRGGLEIDADLETHHEGDKTAERTRIFKQREQLKLTPLQKAVLRFSIMLLNQKLDKEEYELALVCASAVLGVKGGDILWHMPDSYPPILSRLIKLAHYMIIQYACEKTGDRPDSHFSHARTACQLPEESDSNGDDEEDDIEEADSRFPQSRTLGHVGLKRRRSEVSPGPESSNGTYELVEKMTQSFMIRRRGSPMGWFLDLRAYGLKVHAATTAAGHINWKGSPLQYKDMSFTMSDFRGMIHQLAKSTKRKLFEELLLANTDSDVPSIPWRMLFDDPSNEREGWNFLSDPRTRLPADGKTWLYERVLCDEKKRSWFTGSCTDGSLLNKDRIRDWMRSVAEFRGKLLVLMHMTGGQPARGPEILSVRHKNTAQGSHRNLFIEDGLVVFVTRYHKGYQTSGDVKIIHRYLAPEVGQLVVWYMWLVLPFVQRMEALLSEKQFVSDHLWPADFDGTVWTSERMTKMIKRVAEEGLGQGGSMGIAGYRTCAIAISRRCVRGTTAFNENDGEEVIDPADEAADRQAGHSSAVAGKIYARESTEMFGAVAEKRRQFRQVSLDWHQFLGFQSTGADIDGRWRKSGNPFEEEAVSAEVDRRMQLRGMDSAAAFVQMTGKTDATFRSEQARAMKAVLAGDGQILVILPTGAGKSILFMLPAFVAPGGMSVVVVPLLALRQDMLDRCSRLSINAAVWDGRSSPDGATIVLVTPELAVQEDFMTFIRRIQRTRQLDRIVVDECHVMLNDQNYFRSSLKQLGKLGKASTQMLLLTATLPPSMEDMLLERMSWTREDTTLVRAPTTRPNIAYSVVDCSSIADTQSPKQLTDARMKLLETLVNHVLQAETAASRRGKVVVMCESRDNANSIAEAGLFKCDAYHAGVPQKRKDRILEDFRGGAMQVLVATSAFGMGVDIPDIRAVISFDNPRNLLDFGQASGRGGRDGQRSYAVIIRGGTSFSKDPIMREYLEASAGCRRVLLDGYFDGETGRQGCQEGEAACDLCGGSGIEDFGGVPSEQGDDYDDSRTGGLLNESSDVSTDGSSYDGDDLEEGMRKAVEAREAEEQREAELARCQEADIIRRQDRERDRPRLAMTQSTKSRVQQEEELKRQLEKWKGRCVVCHIAGFADRHTLNNCQRPESKPAERERARATTRGGLRFPEATTMCWKCMIPKSICDKWSGENLIDTRGWCQYYGIVPAIVYGIKHGRPDVWRRAMDRSELQGRSDADMMAWMVQPHAMLSSQIVWLFMYLLEMADL